MGQGLKAARQGVEPVRMIRLGEGAGQRACWSYRCARCTCVKKLRVACGGAAAVALGLRRGSFSNQEDADHDHRLGLLPSGLRTWVWQTVVPKAFVGEQIGLTWNGVYQERESQVKPDKTVI